MLAAQSPTPLSFQQDIEATQVTWQRNATNGDHGEEEQLLREEEALAISNIYDKDKEILIEDKDHLDPYGDEKSEQILPFQRTGNMD